ncbi:MAG: CvpA family protein [Gammaproteobacteria bacterium]
MTPFDYAFIGILLSFAVAGLARGFVSEILGIIAWVASIWASIRLGDAFEPFVHAFTDQPTARWLIASATVGMIVFVVIAVIAHLMTKAIKASFVGPLNRMLGFLFGAGKALIIIGVLTFIGLQFGLAKQEWWKKSHLAPVALHASMLLDRVVGFDSLLKGDRKFEMPKAVQEAEERARQLMQDIREAKEATSSPQPEQ